jgi:hypothetical protein
MAVICGMCQKCFYGTQRLVEHTDRSRDCRYVEDAKIIRHFFANKPNSSEIG